MKKTERSLEEINRIGLESLVNALGTDDAEQFLEHCRSGVRDYTEERHAWLDRLQRDDVIRQVQGGTLDDNREASQPEADLTTGENRDSRSKGQRTQPAAVR
jgi:hypothetical protein